MSNVWITDAVSLSRKQPGRFNLPPKSMLDEVVVGDYLKIAFEDPDNPSHGREFFWCLVTHCNHNPGAKKFYATIDNDLILYPEYKTGEMVVIYYDDVFVILKKDATGPINPLAMN